MFNVTIEGLDELQRVWEQEALRAVSDGLREGVERGVKDGAEEARRTHRWKNQTGETERNTQGRLGFSGPGKAEGIIICDVPWGLYLATGTKPHEIHAKGGGWLAWEQPQGDAHFAKVVHHPGTKPDPFMTLAFYKAERVVIRFVEEGAERAASIMNR